LISIGRELERILPSRLQSFKKGCPNAHLDEIFELSSLNAQSSFSFLQAFDIRLELEISILAC
jgi:hypothetical protein